MENQVRVWIYWSPGQDDRLASMRTNVEEAMVSLGLNPAAKTWICLMSDKEASQHRAWGTPSIKVNGIDVEQDLMMYEQYGIWPRKYMDAGQEISSPRVAIIREAIIDALARKRAAKEGRL